MHLIWSLLKPIHIFKLKTLAPKSSVSKHDKKRMYAFFFIQLTILKTRANPKNEKITILRGSFYLLFEWPWG